MDDVERMYRHLVRTIRANFSPFLTQPFEVGELYQTVLPYRLHRRELGLETNQDYEMALLELLSGARGFLVVDDRVRDRLAVELSSTNPDPEVIREFASSRVALAPEPLRLLETEGRPTGSQPVVPSALSAREPTPPASSPSITVTSATAPMPRISAPAPVRPVARPSAIAMPAAGGQDLIAPPTEPGARRAARPITIAPTGEDCPYCKGDLPAGRHISFCPHCGQDLTVVHCPACGGELEHGWKFCVTCGRSAEKH